MTTPIPSDVKETAAEPNPWFHSPAVHVPVLVFLFSCAAAREAFDLTALSSDDIWWHLRTGIWILQNGAIPHHGLFSQSANLPWIASSWFYEVLLAVVYKFLGLRAIPVLAMAFTATLAVLTFLLAGGWHGNFWVAVGLSALAQYVSFGVQPLPIFVSILFFGVELLLLFESQRCGSVRPLLWLPFLFLAWSNLHLQFIIGLCLLALFVLAELARPILGQWGVTPGNTRREIRPPILGIVLGSSVIATLLTPYTFHLFPEVLKDIYSRASFRHFEEMSSMGFRQPRDYLLALVVMAAFLALGRRRSSDLFQLSIMLAGTLLAFRVTRDGWCVLLSAIAVLGAAFGSKSAQRKSEKAFRWAWEKPALAICVVAVLTIIATGFIGGSGKLMHKMSARFPVTAADFIRANHLQQPLFNSYAWGGFLVWYLPDYPICVDGRVGLYGDAFLNRYDDLASGSQRLESDPVFARSGTILLEKESALAKALTTIPTLSSRYRVLYSDDLAMVIVPSPERQAP